MKNLILFAFLAFALTGLLTTPMISNSFADAETAPGRDQGKKTATGCEESNPGKAKNNPNCNGSSSGGFSSCDTEGSVDGSPDGAIDAVELAVYLDLSELETQLFIDIAEENAKGNTIIDGVINTTAELKELNTMIEPDC